MIVVIPSVRATAEGSFDVEMSCALCGHRTRASVRGEGIGGVHGGTAAHYAVAEHRAGLDAYRDAMQKLRGCPCPACGGHDPQTIQWAKKAEERARRRRWCRIWLGPVTLPLVPLAGLGFAAYAAISGDSQQDASVHHGPRRRRFADAGRAFSRIVTVNAERLRA
jgi:hypothetical protein